MSHLQLLCQALCMGDGALELQESQQVTDQPQAWGAFSRCRADVRVEHAAQLLLS